jgi:hypothetical protein
MRVRTFIIKAAGTLQCRDYTMRAKQDTCVAGSGRYSRRTVF